VDRGTLIGPDMNRNADGTGQRRRIEIG